MILRITETYKRAIIEVIYLDASQQPSRHTKAMTRIPTLIPAITLRNPKSNHIQDITSRKVNKKK